MRVKHPTTGVIQGNLQYTIANGNPDWDLAQWNSRLSIYGKAPTQLSSGAYQWANRYKLLVMGPTGKFTSDLRLMVNSINEYEGRYRQSGEPWPHLLVSQSISVPTGKIGTAAPWISELTRLDYNLEAKLNYANHVYTNGYNSTLHAAQFVNYFTVQNLKPGSPDYGNYLWFGLLVYDDRTPLPGLFIKHDAGTGKLIYNIGIEPFCTSGLAVGAWKKISGDVLPYIKDALDAAWQLGYLTNSMNYADYKIGAMNMGWEVPGLSHVTMQIRNFGLKAYGLFWPESYEFNTDGNKQGWNHHNMVDLGSPGPLNGTWSFSVPGTDPKFVGPAIRVDADTFPKVKVRMQNAGNPAGASVAQLFWRRTGDAAFNEARSKKVNIGNGGGWVE